MSAPIPVLVTGGMPEDFVGKVMTDGYDFRHIENPSDEDLAWAEVIVGFAPINRLAAAKKLKWLQLPGSGVDGYADHPDFPKHVLLTNATGAFGRAIAEYAFAAAFALMRRFHLYRDRQNEAVWTRQGDEMTPTGKKVLIMGAGDIGSNTAQLFKKFDCDVTGVRRVTRDCPPCFDRMITLEQVEDVLGEMDIIVCAMPNTPLTRGYFTRERLSKLKSSAIFVNVGRGTIVDHYALAEVLDAGGIAGAALDVTDPEPLPSDHPLWKSRNALITPHVSGGTFDGLEGKADFFYGLCRENLELYKNGQPLKNMVDLKTGYRVTTG